MLAVDEDLRYGRTPAGASDHLVAPRRFFDNVDFGIGDAFSLEQHAGASAVGTKHCRVKFDFSHSGGNSKLGSWGEHVLQLRRQRQGAKPRVRMLLSGHPPTRNARANIKTPTDAAPARFSTRAHSSTVAPVVMTSSTTTTRFPAKLRPAWTAKAPRTLRSRAAGPRRPCEGVRRRRTSQSAATSGPPAERIACANSAAWL